MQKMVQRANTKCCGVSILFVVLVTYFIIPEFECKRLLRAGETGKHDDGKARNSLKHNKPKPKVEYTENANENSKAPKSENRHDKSGRKEDGDTRTDLTRPEMKKKHTDESAESQRSKSKPDKTQSNLDEKKAIHIDESAKSMHTDGKTDLTKPEKKDKHAGESATSKGSKSKPDKNHGHLDKQKGTRTDESSKSKSSKSKEDKNHRYNDEKKDKHTNKSAKNKSSMSKEDKNHSNNDEKKDKHTDESDKSKDSKSKSEEKHKNVDENAEVEESGAELTNNSKSKSKQSEKSSERSDNHAHDKHKDSKGSANTKLDNVTPGIDVDTDVETDFNVGTTVTEESLLSDSSNSLSYVVQTTTPYSEPTTLEKSVISTEFKPKSVSSSDMTHDTPMYTSELNRESVSSTDTTTNTPIYTTKLNGESGPDSEHDSLNASNTEPGIIIKPPFHGRKKCKEGTPPCCIDGQLEINLGTINQRARATGVLEGVTATVSNKPNKWFIRCSFSAEIKVSFETMGNEGCFGCTKGPFCGRRLLQLDLELSRNKRRNTLFDISDSFHKNDGATVHADFPNITIYPRHSAGNRTRHIRIQRALNSNTDKITLFIGNQFMRLMSDNRLDENFCDNDLFHLNGQFDPESGGMSPNEITIGINRAITSKEDDTSFGICSAALKWACPWHENY